MSEVVENQTSANVSIFWLAATVLGLISLALIAPYWVLLFAFLGIVVTTHEAGHYFMAKRAGMKPTEFFWGFGPEIISFERNGCRYGLKVLSVGGYVRLEGMTSTSELPEGFAEEDTFRAATPIGRLITILGGPVVNFIVAIIAFAASGYLAGLSLVESIKHGFVETYKLITLTLISLWQWVSNIGDYINAVFGEVDDAPVRFMSPVAQAEATEMFVQTGFGGILVWLAILSGAIGIVNLLPLPPLDGAHAVAAIIDSVTRKVRNSSDYVFNMKKVLPVAYVTVVLLFALTLTALIMDIRALEAV